MSNKKADDEWAEIQQRQKDSEQEYDRLDREARARFNREQAAKHIQAPTVEIEPENPQLF